MGRGEGERMERRGEDSRSSILKKEVIKKHCIRYMDFIYY